MKPIKTILHPTDFSAAAQFGLELACALARDHGARLILLHIVPGPSRPSPRENGAAPRKVKSCEIDQVAHRVELREHLEHLPLPGLTAPVERRVETGDVAHVILRVARETECDLIVMGSHGKSAAVRRLLGSVAEKVAGHAHCPVVTARMPSANHEPAAEPANEEIAVIL
jgi:nucleotide-binding universal stress UspA family protein